MSEVRIAPESEMDLDKIRIYLARESGNPDIATQVERSDAIFALRSYIFYHLRPISGPQSLHRRVFTWSAPC